MSAINSVLLVVHILSVIAILSLLLHQWNKTPRKFNPGILHAGLTALIAGIAMVGMFSSVHPDEVLNHTKYGVKFVVLITILVIGYKNVKKPELAKKTWLTLVGLTVINILIASFWR
jgi:cell division protein FtsW (lipid II flippase)